MRRLTYDAVIAGGGFAGLAAAAALADAGLCVAVVEQGRRSGEHGLRGELLHPSAVASLEKLGLADVLREAGAASVRGFAAYASANAAPAILPYGGARGLALEHHVIVDSLRRALTSRRGVRIHDGRVHDVVREGSTVAGLRCADGRVFSSPLVVAADGRHSHLRGALGLGATSMLLSHSIGTTIDSRLLAVPDHGHVFVGGPGPVLVYPLAGGSARVNVDVPLDAPRGRRPVLDYIAERYADFVPPAIFDAILAAFAARPLLGAANHAIVTSSCAVPGAVLLGDAGGCSHPLTATGMTCGVHDAISLASAIRESGASGDPNRALLAYEKDRYQFVRAREAFAQSLYDVFRSDDDGARALRDAVFHYWRSARARRASMAILAGDESRTGIFIAEYARVVGTAAMLSARAAWRERSVAAPAAALSGLAVAGRTSARLIVEKVASAARARFPGAAVPWTELLTLPGKSRTRERSRAQSIPRAPNREHERAAAG